MSALWEQVAKGRFVSHWGDADDDSRAVMDVHQVGYAPRLYFTAQRRERRLCKVLAVNGEKVKRPPEFSEVWLDIDNSRYFVEGIAGAEHILLVALARDEISGEAKDSAMYNVFWTHIVEDDTGRAWFKKHARKACAYYTGSLISYLCDNADSHPGLRTTYNLWMDNAGLRKKITQEKMLAFARHARKDPTVIDAIEALTLAHYPEGFQRSEKNVVGVLVDYVLQSVQQVTRVGVDK